MVPAYLSSCYMYYTSRAADFLHLWLFLLYRSCSKIFAVRFYVPVAVFIRSCPVSVQVPVMPTLNVHLIILPYWYLLEVRGCILYYSLMHHRLSVPVSVSVRSCPVSFVFVLCCSCYVLYPLLKKS